MGLLRKRVEPVDEALRCYIASAPREVARADLLAMACISQVSRLPEAAADRISTLVTLECLEPAVRVARQVLYQDDAIAALVMRKMAVLVRQFSEWSGAQTADDWFREVFNANGLDDSQQNFVLRPVCDDPTGEAVDTAERFRLVFVAVSAGHAASPADAWTWYSSLYTDPGLYVMNYRLIAWAALALARLRNAGALWRVDHDSVDERLATVPAMQEAGWYPLPQKSLDRILMPNGDVSLKCYWDGAEWTERCIAWKDGRWVTWSWSGRHAPRD